MAKDMLDELLDEILEKKQAPLVAQARRKILQQSKFGAKKRKSLKVKSKELMRAEVSTDYTQPLAKNEYDFQTNGSELKMEFGPEVPDLIKKRAMDWAKRKGLKAKEISLSKSSETNSFIIFVKNEE